MTRYVERNIRTCAGGVSFASEKSDKRAVCPLISQCDEIDLTVDICLRILHWHLLLRISHENQWLKRNQIDLLVLSLALSMFSSPFIFSRNNATEGKELNDLPPSPPTTGPQLKLGPAARSTQRTRPLPTQLSDRQFSGTYSPTEYFRELRGQRPERRRWK